MVRSKAKRLADTLVYRSWNPRRSFSATFQRLSAPLPNGQTLYTYLSTCAEKTLIPGVVIGSAGSLSDAFASMGASGWTPAEISRVLDEMQREGAVEYDARARLIWIVEDLSDRSCWPANPCVVSGWARYWELIPECALKVRIWEALNILLARPEFDPRYRQAFLRGCERPIVQDAGAAMRLHRDVHRKGDGVTPKHKPKRLKPRRAEKPPETPPDCPAHGTGELHRLGDRYPESVAVDLDPPSVEERAGEHARQSEQPGAQPPVLEMAPQPEPPPPSIGFSPDEVCEPWEFVEPDEPEIEPPAAVALDAVPEPEPAPEPAIGISLDDLAADEELSSQVFAAYDRQLAETAHAPAGASGEPLFGQRSDAAGMEGSEGKIEPETLRGLWNTVCVPAGYFAAPALSPADIGRIGEIIETLAWTSDQYLAAFDRIAKTAEWLKANKRRWATFAWLICRNGQRAHVPLPAERFLALAAGAYDEAWGRGGGSTGGGGGGAQRPTTRAVVPTARGAATVPTPAWNRPANHASADPESSAKARAVRAALTRGGGLAGVERIIAEMMQGDHKGGVTMRP